MARPLRIEFAGALYHITSRGDGRDAIFLENGDRERWLNGLGQVCKRFKWVVHAYCQMENHYHLLAETPDSNLSAGMRQLNGVYTQAFNRIHHRVGHLFQGRYKAILVQKDTYLLALSRYIVLNPVRENGVRSCPVTFDREGTDQDLTPFPRRRRFWMPACSRSASTFHKIDVGADQSRSMGLPMSSCNTIL